VDNNSALPVNADTTQPPDLYWQRVITPHASLTVQGDAWRFANAPADPPHYTNAQVDDYQGLPRRRFRWRPPLTLTVRARFSHPNGANPGTAGFGFWNDPFLMTGLRPPALPRALWFFYGSPESDMKLALDVPGSGWKAAAVDALNPAAIALSPTALLTIPLMNIPAVYRRLWPLYQRALNVSESLVPTDRTAWHTYTINWQPDSAAFSVDGDLLLTTDTPPHGPLGFVMWIDNQALVATPQGRFRWRVLPVPEPQWMDVSALTIQPG
jgi:hypothetical protein